MWGAPWVKGCDSCRRLGWCGGETLPSVAGHCSGASSARAGTLQVNLRSALNAEIKEECLCGYYRVFLLKIGFPS